MVTFFGVIAVGGVLFLGYCRGQFANPLQEINNERSLSPKIHSKPNLKLLNPSRMGRQALFSKLLLVHFLSTWVDTDKKVDNQS